MSSGLSGIVVPHIDRTDLADRMSRFYAGVDAVIAGYGPICRNRGLCCKFEAYAHRLYVTSPELVYFLRGVRAEWKPPGLVRECPYQLGGVCTVREWRPLGCRVFFCDPAAGAWQGPVYERFLDELKSICGEFEVEYCYVEWLTALAELGVAGSGGTEQGSVFWDGGPTSTHRNSPIGLDVGPSSRL